MLLIAIMASILPSNACSVSNSTYTVTGAKVATDTGIFVYIDIPAKRLYLFKNDNLIKVYPVATGTKETPTPIGVYNVVSKGKWGKGFGGSWMGLNVPWGTYGIHGTTRPGSIGHDASHGCIRMRNRDACELYDYISFGDLVEIYGGPYGPFGRGFRDLKPGDKGSDVMEVQRRLKILGYYNGSIDGCYGTVMEHALNRFQTKQRLPITNTINKVLYKKLGIILMD